MKSVISKLNPATRALLPMVFALAFVLPAACGGGGGGGGGDGDTTAPTVPTGVAAGTVSETRIDLSWTPSTDDTAVTGYRIYRDGGGPVATADGAATAYSDTGLTPDTTYCYQVSAIDAANNESAMSTETCAATDPDLSAPTIPSINSVSALSGTQVSIDWSASTDNVAMHRYLIYYGGGGALVSSVDSGTLGYTDGGLTDATQYCYQVSAKDTAGNESSKSAQACTTTPDITAPTAPTLVSAAPLSATSVSITWTGSTDNVAVTEYYIYQGMSASAVGSDVTSRTYTSLTPGTEYCFEVSAIDAADNESAKSGTLCTTTFTVPFVTGTVPADGTTYNYAQTQAVINFSEPMDTTVNIDGSASPPIDVVDQNYNGAGDSVTLTFSTPLLPATGYTVTILGTNVSVNGVPMGSDYIFHFTTTSAGTPIVFSTIPADGKTAVSTTTDIIITFSQAMDQPSVEDAVTISGYAGTKSFSWGNDTMLIISSLNLASDAVYTVSVAAFAEDIYGTPMGTSYNFSFSTGATISGWTVSGQVFGDPASVHDDDLTGTYVVLRDAPNWDDPTVFLNTGANGLYQFDLVQDGTYYPAALLDSNQEDDGPDPKFGDALGVWNIGAPLNVSGSDQTGINITLVDPEAISGHVLYAGAYSAEVYSDGSIPGTLQVYAYAETAAMAYDADMTLANYQGPGIFYTVADRSGGGTTWTYGLNPYLMPELSVSGSFAYDDTVTPTLDAYIPPGNYQVLAWLEMPGYLTSEPLIGFADNLAAIDDTGDDAGGVDVTLHDTMEIGGKLWIVSLGGDIDYPDARVSLLGWPLQSSPSNQIVGSNISVWTYQGAPLGVPVAFHMEPDPADANSLMAMNEQYRVLDASDAWPGQWFEVRVMDRATAGFLAAQAGTTLRTDRGQISGSVRGAFSFTLGDNPPIPGLTVTISTGDQAQYFYSDLSIGAPYTRHDSDPQFAFMNVVPPPDGKAVITFSHPDSSIVIDSVTVPVRADEVTMFWHSEVSDPGGVAAGVTISGAVGDVQADTLFGPGATVTLLHRDGTALETALTDSNSEYFFQYVPSLMPVYLKGSYAGTGYVPWNTAVFDAVDTYLEDPAMLPQSLFVDVANQLPAFNEPGWNSTLASYTWFGFEVQDLSGNKVPGVTFSTDAPGAVIYYWDNVAGVYTTSGTTSDITNGPQVLGYAPDTSEGVWNFSYSDGGSYAGSADAPLITGEFTYWAFQ